ncbi:MAG: DUF4199 domain-containing protein [Chitinophagaceae bacterium]|nr:DUF4199 domain-containing protein [Chitinophagaceae bacterium]
MKPVVYRYGLYAALAIVVLSAVHFFFLFPVLSWTGAEVAGYLTMILSMIFVFMGIRHYRDHVNQGFLSFGQGLKTGVLIVLIPAVFFGLFDLFYTEVLNPKWADEYYGYHIQKIKETVPADKVAARLQKLQEERDMFGNPIFQFLLMAATVFVIGLIATIISTLTLRRSRNSSAA